MAAPDAYQLEALRVQAEIRASTLRVCATCGLEPDSPYGYEVNWSNARGAWLCTRCFFKT